MTSAETSGWLVAVALCAVALLALSLAREFLRTVAAMWRPVALVFVSAMLLFVDVGADAADGRARRRVCLQRPGVGLSYYTAAANADYPVELGVTVVVGLATVLGKLLADISYAILDPRVRR